MIDAIQSLWRELLGSWWVLVVLPILAVVRWLLTSRWGWIARVRGAFFGLRSWDGLLTPPAGATVRKPHPPAEEDTNGAGGAPANGGSAPLAPAEYRRRWFLELIESGLVALLLVFFVIRPFIVQAFYIPSPSMVETLEVYDRILVNKFVYRIHPPQRGDIVVFEPPKRATAKIDDDWIKRVIAVPGDRLAVHDNHLYLNGKPQSEPYVSLLQRGSDQPGEQHVLTGQYAYRFPDMEGLQGLQPGESAYLYAPNDGPVAEEGVYRVVRTTDTSPKPNGDYLFFVHYDPQDGPGAIVPEGKLFVMGDNRNDSEDSHYWGYLDQKRVLGQAFCIFWPIPRFRFLPHPSTH